MAQNHVVNNHLQDNFFNFFHEFFDPIENDLIVNYDSDESDREIVDDEIEQIAQQNLNEHQAMNIEVNYNNEDMQEQVSFAELKKNLFSFFMNFSNLI